MSLQTPTTIRSRPNKLYGKAKATPIGRRRRPAVKSVGKPDALIGHVRFDERGRETERLAKPRAAAPFLDSTPIPAPPALSRGNSMAFREKRRQHAEDFRVNRKELLPRNSASGIVAMRMGHAFDARRQIACSANRLSFTRRAARSGRARFPAGVAMTDALNATPQQKSEILMQALPHMLRYDDTIVVVKYGGHAMGDEQKARDFAKDMVLLEQSGINPVVVHGGGPQI